MPYIPWDETVPDGATVDANTLDTVIQSFKAMVRERMVSLGVTNWATDDPVTWLKLIMGGVSPFLAGGTASFQIRANDGVTVNVTFNNDGTVTFANTVTLASLVVAGTSMFNDNVTLAGAQGNIAWFDAGNSGAAIALNWNNGNNQKITLTAATPAITFSNPSDGAVYLIRLVQDAAGNRAPTWPANVVWSSGFALLPTVTGLRTDLISLVYDQASTKYMASIAGVNFNV